MEWIGIESLFWEIKKNSALMYLSLNFCEMCLKESKKNIGEEALQWKPEIISGTEQYCYYYY